MFPWQGQNICRLNYLALITDWTVVSEVPDVTKIKK